MAAEQPQNNEEKWLQQARQGDVQAYGCLYELYAPRLLHFFASHLDNRMDAEDLTGEVFLKVWRALPGYKGMNVSFAAYLFRAARNSLIDFYRRAGRRPTPLPLEEDLVPGSDDDPAALAQTGDEWGRVQEVLALLSEDYRTVLSLRFLAGLSNEETAHAMGRSSGAIRVLQHRALAALRKLLPSRG